MMQLCAWRVDSNFGCIRTHLMARLGKRHRDMERKYFQVNETKLYLSNTPYSSDLREQAHMDANILHMCQDQSLDSLLK